MISPRFAGAWLGLGVAIATLFTARDNGAVWFFVALGAWLSGGYLALKMIEKDDDE